MEIRLIQITWQSALKNTDFKLMIYKSDYCIDSGQILFFNLLKNTAGLSNTPKLLSHGCKTKNSEPVDQSACLFPAILPHLH